MTVLVRCRRSTIHKLCLSTQQCKHLGLYNSRVHSQLTLLPPQTYLQHHRALSIWCVPPHVVQEECLIGTNLTAALCLYDYILTFSGEVEHIWQRKLCGVTVLFVLNRYAVMSGCIARLIQLKLWRGFASMSTPDRVSPRRRFCGVRREETYRIFIVVRSPVAHFLHLLS